MPAHECRLLPTKDRYGCRFFQSFDTTVHLTGRITTFPSRSRNGPSNLIASSASETHFLYTEIDSLACPASTRALVAWASRSMRYFPLLISESSAFCRTAKPANSISAAILIFST